MKTAEDTIRGLEEIISGLRAELKKAGERTDRLRDERDTARLKVRELAAAYQTVAPPPDWKNCKHPFVWPDGDCVDCGVLATTMPGHTEPHHIMVPRKFAPLLERRGAAPAVSTPPHAKSTCKHCGFAIELISESWIKVETDGVYCDKNPSPRQIGVWDKHEPAPSVSTPRCPRCGNDTLQVIPPDGVAPTTRVRCYMCNMWYAADKVSHFAQLFQPAPSPLRTEPELPKCEYGCDPEHGIHTAMCHLRRNPPVASPQGESK